MSTNKELFIEFLLSEGFIPITNAESEQSSDEAYVYIKHIPTDCGEGETYNKVTSMHATFSLFAEQVGLSAGYSTPLYIRGSEDIFNIKAEFHFIDVYVGNIGDVKTMRAIYHMVFDPILSSVGVRSYAETLYPICLSEVDLDTVNDPITVEQLCAKYVNGFDYNGSEFSIDLT